MIIKIILLQCNLDNYMNPKLIELLFRTVCKE